MAVPQLSHAGRESLARLAHVVGAAGVLVSGYVHYYLYFEGGYRGIQPESAFGMTVSRAFILNALAAVIIAEALVVALRWTRLQVPAMVAGFAFAASSLGAYALTRTTGLLGFSDPQAGIEAVIAVSAETVAIVALAVLFVVRPKESLFGGPRR